MKPLGILNRKSRCVDAGVRDRDTLMPRALHVLNSAHYGLCSRVTLEWVKDSGQWKIIVGKLLCCDELLRCHVCTCSHSRPRRNSDGDVKEHYMAAIPPGPLCAEGHSCIVTWNMVLSALYHQSLPSRLFCCVAWRGRGCSILAFFPPSGLSCEAARHFCMLVSVENPASYSHKAPAVQLTRC